MTVVSTGAGDTSSSSWDEKSMGVLTLVVVVETSVGAPKDPFIAFIMEWRSGVETVPRTAAAGGGARFLSESLVATEDVADSLIECARRLRILASGSTEDTPLLTGCLGCNRKALGGVHVGPC
jgi:hypothetical protein